MSEDYETIKKLKELLQNGGKISSPNRDASLFCKQGVYVVKAHGGGIYRGGYFENAVKALDAFCFEDALSFESEKEYREYLKSFNEEG